MCLSIWKDITCAITTLNQVYSETFPKDDSKNLIVAKGMRSLGNENKTK